MKSNLTTAPAALLSAACLAAAAAIAAGEQPRDWSDLPWPEAADGPRFRKSYICVEVTNPYLKQTSARNGYYNYAGGLGLQLFQSPEKNVHLSRRTALSGGRHREIFGGAFSIHESAAVADFGAIAPAGGGGAFQPFDLSWTTLFLDYLGGESSAEFTLSRLTPAALFYTPESAAWFFSGGKLNTTIEAGTRAVYAGERGAKGWVRSSVVPGYAAVSDGKDVVVARAGLPEPGRDDPLAGLPMAYLEEEGGWMLVWYGENSAFYSCGDDFRQENFYRADSPFLLLFENAPVEVRYTGEELEFEFLGEAGHAAIVPVLGERFPPIEETVKWADGIPGDIVEQCGWWARHLCEFPTGVTETYAYDRASDTATVRNKFEFKRIRPGGKRFLPLPPMVALAAEYGFPVKIAGEVEDSGLVTAFGPYRGVVSDADTIEFAVSGMDKYVASRDSEKAAPPGDKAYLQTELAAQVEAILEARHLAPYWPAVTDFAHCYGRKWWERMCWGLPGETLYFLARVLPLLEDGQAGRVRDYLKKEKAAYPPHGIIHLSSGDGAMRNWHQMEAAFYPFDLPERERNFHCLYELLPAETIYHASFYYRDVAPEELEADLPFYRNAVAGWRFHSDWATGGWYRWERKLASAGGFGANVTDPQYGHGGVADANRWLAATIGYARMADMAGGEPERAEARGLLARAAILRFGLEKTGAYLQAAGLSDADPVALPVAHLDELGFSRKNTLGWFNQRWVAFQGLTPEVAVFLRDYSRERALAQLDDYTRYNPAWYLRLARSRYVGESHYHFPSDVYYTFLAEALISGVKPEQLEMWLDAPWVGVGDYYFLAKLALAIRAYAGK